MAKEIQTTNYTFNLRDELTIGDLEEIEPIQNKIQNGEIGNVKGIVEIIGKLDTSDKGEEEVKKKVRNIKVNEDFDKLSNAITEIFESIEKKKDKQNK